MESSDFTIVSSLSTLLFMQDLNIKHRKLIFIMPSTSNSLQKCQAKKVEILAVSFCCCYFNYLFPILCTLVFCLQVCLCEDVGSPKQELQIVVSYHVGAGNQTFGRIVSAPNH